MTNGSINGSRMIPMILAGVLVTVIASAIGGGFAAFSRIGSIETALNTELVRSLAVDRDLNERLEGRRVEIDRRLETLVTREQFREELEDFQKQREQLLAIHTAQRAQAVAQDEAYVEYMKTFQAMFAELTRQQRAVEIERRGYRLPDQP